MTRLSAQMSRACEALGLSYEAPFTLTMGHDSKIQAVGRVRELGPKNGMLIISDYSRIEPFLEQLAKSEFGFSVMAEPGEDEEFDLEDYREMFVDWGWGGPDSQKPNWLHE